MIGEDPSASADLLDRAFKIEALLPVGMVLCLISDSGERIVAAIDAQIPSFSFGGYAVKCDNLRPEVERALRSMARCVAIANILAR